MQKQKDFGLMVYVTEKGIEDAIRRFKKRVINSGILDELKERQYYIKPSLRKHQSRRSIKK